MLKIRIMESLYLIILIFFIIIFITPLGFRIKFFYDVKKNCGAISIKLWFIWIKKIKLKIKGKKIFLIEKHKNSEIEIELNEPQIRFLRFFGSEVKDKVKIRSVMAHSKVGLDNPMFAGLFSSAVSDFILSYFAFVKNKRPSACFRLTNYTNFYAFDFIIGCCSRFSLSILDVVYSFAMSVLRTGKDRILEENMGAN